MKIKVIKPETTSFKEVVVTEPTVANFVQAERISGDAGNIELSLALVSQCCTFDGKKLPPEELQKLKIADFFELQKSLGLEELTKSASQLSSSSEKGVLDTTK